MMNRKSILISSVLLLAFGANADEEQVASGVYSWDDLEIETSETRKRRNVFKGSTDTLEYLQVHASTVEPGMAAHAAHSHARPLL